MFNKQGAIRKFNLRKDKEKPRNLSKWIRKDSLHVEE